MRRRVSLQKLLVALGLLVIVGGLVASHYGVFAPAPSLAERGSTPYWQGRIRAVGGESAYQEFSRAMGGLSQQEQHGDAHSFGGALYETLGLPGLSICDTNFTYGCFHQFIGLAISEYGIAVVAELHRLCNERLHGSHAGLCHHAIGHGIMASFGYTSSGYRLSDLSRALSACGENGVVSRIQTVPECYRGVFMEYNFFAVAQGEGLTGTTIRPDQGDVLYPCDILASTYRPACFYTQSQWWFQTLRRPDTMTVPAALARMGEWCRQAPAGVLRDICFAGIGTTVAWDLNTSAQERALSCEQASVDVQEAFLCKTTLAFWLPKVQPESSAEDVCIGLAGERFAACRVAAEGSAPQF